MTATPPDDPDPRPPRRPKRRRRALVGVTLMGAISLGGVYFDPFYVPPHVPDRLPLEERMPGSLRLLTLNVAHGRGTAFHQLLTRPQHIRRNLRAVAKLIRLADADVVALQELDAPSAWSGGFDHLEFLAREAGYAHSYHGLHVERRTPRLAYGTGILSRYPLSAPHSARFGLNAVDTKGFVFAQVETPAGSVDVVSVHLDFKRDAERAIQLGILGAYLEARSGRSDRLVIAGDFNCAIGDGGGILEAFTDRHELLVPPVLHGDVGTFPSNRPRRRIDYVLATDALPVQRRQVLPIAVSDHLPVLTEVRLER